MTPQTRLWCHDGQWRIQDRLQLTDSNGTSYDAWESRRSEDGHVLFFETEALAEAYRDAEKASEEC